MNSQLTICLVGGFFVLVAAIITGACTMLTPLVTTKPELALGGAVLTFLVCLVLVLGLALALSLRRSES